MHASPMESTLMVFLMVHVSNLELCHIFFNYFIYVPYVSPTLTLYCLQRTYRNIFGVPLDHITVKEYFVHYHCFVMFHHDSLRFITSNVNSC